DYYCQVYDSGDYYIF
nr:immunoglobulin light chain junction region [Macaca mulatta]